MSRGMTKFLLLLLLFMIGVMIGMQIEPPKTVSTTGPEGREGSPTSFIERIENGKPVYVPSHPSRDPKNSDQIQSERDVAEGWTDSAPGSSPDGFTGEAHPHESGSPSGDGVTGEANRGVSDVEPAYPVMTTEGGFDRFGKRMGDRFTQSAQRILEVAIGFFVKK